MGRKAKRLKILKRIERLNAQASQPVPVVSNSEMQERLKEEKVEVAPDTVFTPETVESIVEEVEEVVEKVQPKPKKITRTRKPRTRKKKTD